MIIDTIKNKKHYTLKKDILHGLKYLEVTDLSSLQIGKYEIKKDKIFAMVDEYNTKNKEDCSLEAHRKYIDLQYIISGEELIGYAPLEQQKIYKEYDSENDIIFYEEEPSFTKLKQGMFAIFYPTDLHMPGIKIIESKKVKKIVIKIKF